MVAKISQEEYENRINKLLKYDKYEYIGVKGEFKGNKTCILIKCEDHGNFHLSISDFLYKHGRCSSCSKCKHFSREEREQQIHTLCENTMYSFAGWDGDYKNANSKFGCKCEIHGEWSVSINVFINSGARCPSCAKHGYNMRRKGTLYCLRSECGQFVKIGITNNIKSRFETLKRNTPFDFHLIELFTHEDGSKAREWEKLFHQSFESANLTGFDGCTEWLKWDPKIPEWFRFIN